MNLNFLPLPVREEIEYLRAITQDFGRMQCLKATSAAVLRRVVNVLPPIIHSGMNAGAGGGGLERMLLQKRRLAPGAQWHAIEPTPNLAQFMRDNIHDPQKRVHVEQNTFQAAAHALSQQPDFRPPQVITSSVSEEVLNREFLQQAQQMLQENGTFVVYIFKDVTARLADVFGANNVEEPREAGGQFVPPWPYLIQSAHKRPKNVCFDPALNGKPPMPKRRKKKDDTSGWWKAISA